MKKQTAAEKFDKVPPWCVVKSGQKYDGPSRWRIESHDGTRCALGPNDDGWSSGCGPYGYIGTESEARRIARLTRPLPSWEPAADAPLPVEGWKVREHAPGRVCVYDANRMYVDKTNPRFPTRAAAYVWAWTEAEADDKPKPITEADVGGAYSVSQRGSSMMIDGGGRTLIRIGHHVRDDGGNRWHVPVAFLVPEHTDGPVATDGPDDRGTLGWPAFDELCKTVDDVEVRVTSQIDGIIARIGPMESFVAEAQALANRMTIVERLVAAQVAKPATLDKPHAAASANDFATAVAGADDGWRDELHEWCSNLGRWEGQWFLATPDGKYAYTDNDAVAGWLYITDMRTLRPVTPADDCSNRVKLDKRRRTCPPPPNLAEWWKPGVKEVPVTAGELAARMVLIKQAENAVPPTYRVGDDVAAWVRNLASAHDTALKDMAEYRTQLATAQTAATAAEGRADTAKKRASEAEEALANVRLRLANAADALGHVSRCSTGCESCRRFAMGAKSRAES